MNLQSFFPVNGHFKTILLVELGECSDLVTYKQRNKYTHIYTIPTPINITSIQTLIKYLVAANSINGHMHTVMP